MDKIEFYEALAHLFYAISNTDRNMSLLEKKRINDVAEDEWNQEVEGIESKEIIYDTIRQLILKKVVWKTPYNFFKDYYHQNEEVFTPELKEKIMQNAEDITMAHARRNKSELISLTHLSRLFWD